MIDEIDNCLRTLKSIAQIEDTERAHGMADDCIIEFLKNIGFGDVAVEYDSIEKWYG